MADSGENLVFSYGTLLDADVQRAVFGRALDGDDDVLVGYTIDYIDVPDPRVFELSGKSVHPIIRPTASPLDKVVGKVLTLTDEELEAGDDYELSMYRRASVTLASGRTAWVYISTPEGDLRDSAD
ncbi:gamma-glutamylcyclotransferase family protein [Microbacterium immunditiarum]|uniref:Gamma-glutamylcyclotransferase AIG2-like domain-containing protein n=1 Tax=Microbacterium immunditiarum TaxID=337480 RepID=A0A7Y9KJI0_9MICO|nr:gamma-glutamylcyclotransferase family protein [Microbacterium immunditiarum]NYE19686.1 hypothetical protein [Microbacterium immunditiarum]